MIICENLVKIYKVADLEVVALQGLDLTVEKGEMLAIVGPSGAGKTTLLNILGGLDRPSAGRVVVHGQDLLKMSAPALDKYRRHQVGFVWQQTAHNLIPYLTAQENVELPMTISGLEWKKKSAWAGELLEMVGLGDRRHHRLAHLSGGEQQRVAIAVALANKPILILADEPTGEVDSFTARGIYELFHSLNEAYDLTTIIVTHDAGIIGWVDRVVAIRDGKTATETRQISGARSRVSDQIEEEEEIQTEELVVVDSAGRLQIPEAYREQYGIGERVRLEPTDEGLLIRPAGGGTRGQGDKERGRQGD